MIILDLIEDMFDLLMPTGILDDVLALDMKRFWIFFNIFC